MSGWLGMKSVDNALFVRGKSIKEIVREQHVLGKLGAQW
jgi:hypothetical protein